MKHFPTLLEALKIIEIDPDIREAWVNFLHIQSVNALVAFYSQPLALWMFVPCGEDGEPMEKPDLWDDWFDGQISYSELPNNLAEELNDEEEAKSFYAYQAAAQRVLFEGWELKEYGFDMSDDVFVVENKAINHTIHFTGNKCEVCFGYSEVTIVDCDIDQFTHQVPQLTPTQSALTSVLVAAIKKGPKQ